MTQAEALQEARRRWGKRARAEIGAIEIATGKQLYFVANHRGFNSTKINGYGDSWEAAFADADRRSESKGEER